MKKFTTFSLFFCFAVAVSVMSAGLIYYQKDKELNSKSPIADTQNIGSEKPLDLKLALTSAELAKHNSSQSCWLLISGKIYDVTSFLNQHPGEAGSILPTCGTDATKAYATKGSPDGKPHSSNANTLLADYFLGDLGQSIKSGSTTPSPKAPPATSFESDDDEFDD